MAKTNKKLLTLFLAAVLTVSAGFALLLARPAEQASADEPYSETWVIKEKWTCTKSFTTDITLEICEFMFQKFNVSAREMSVSEVSNGNLRTAAVANQTESSGTVSYRYLKMENGVPMSYIDYSEWKENAGKIKFYKDTSAAGFEDLREWLEANAIEQAVKYTVTFNDGAKTLGTVEAEENSKLSTVDLSSIPTAKTGYTFKGWRRALSDSIVNLANETITADVTYYAVYEINKYTVTFNSEAGILKTVTVDYGTKANTINLTNVAPDKEGYAFKGWARTNGGEVVDLSTVTISQSTAFFAVYEKQTFEVKFYNGATVLKTVSVDYGTNLSAVNLSGVTTDKTGFTFRGWALSDGGVTVNASNYVIKSAVNFYAVYDVEGKATVVFKDGVTSLKTVTVDLGAKASEIDISDLELEKSGYTFKGWARSENGTVVDLETVSVNEYTVFYAVYEKNANNVLDDVSSWLTTKTGIAFSATGVLVLALGVYLLLRRK